MKHAATIAVCFLFLAIVRSAAAAGPPGNHRHMLSERLTRDMNDTRNRAAPRAFSDDDWRRVRVLGGLVDANFVVSDGEAGQLNEYYDLIRKRVREDVHLIQNQARGHEPTDEQIEQWESDRESIRSLGHGLANGSESAKRISHMIYGSVPGWALREFNMVPEIYYALDDETGTLGYVGPAQDSSLAALSSPTITVDSPLYVPWIETHRDAYKHWLRDHHERYSRLSEKEPKLASAVSGASTAKENSASAKSKSSPYGASGSSKTVRSGSVSHSTASSWGAQPPRMVLPAPSTPLFRPTFPTAPSTLRH